MKKLKVIFLGTPDFVQPIKKELAKHFTLVDSLEDSDLGVIAAWGHILTKKELETPKYGCINIHPSLLPKYRGSSPIQAAILNGDKISGITIIKMDELIDHGPIIYQEELGLSSSDNFDILSKKMFLKASEILPKIVKDFIAGRVKLQGQTHARATYCNHLSRQDGYFDINNPPTAEVLDRMIRAYHPWPGVWCRWKEKIVKFLPSSPVIASERSSRGNLPTSEDSSLIAQNDRRSTQNDNKGEYLLQMEGKKPISFTDFLNGYPDFPQVF